MGIGVKIVSTLFHICIGIWWVGKCIIGFIKTCSKKAHRNYVHALENGIL